MRDQHIESLSSATDHLGAPLRATQHCYKNLLLLYQTKPTIVCKGTHLCSSVHYSLQLFGSETASHCPGVVPRALTDLRERHSLAFVAWAWATAQTGSRTLEVDMLQWLLTACSPKHALWNAVLSLQNWWRKLCMPHKKAGFYHTTAPLTHTTFIIPVFHTEESDLMPKHLSGKVTCLQYTYIAFFF